MPQYAAISNLDLFAEIKSGEGQLGVVSVNGNACDPDGSGLCTHMVSVADLNGIDELVISAAIARTNPASDRAVLKVELYQCPPQSTSNFRIGQQDYVFNREFEGDEALIGKTIFLIKGDPS